MGYVPFLYLKKPVFLFYQVLFRRCNRRNFLVWICQPIRQVAESGKIKKN